MTKDYYKILNIPEFSTSDEIKSAYRKLARKWHPDVAGNSFDSMNKFKEINEAYEILSDKLKKADYDKARKFYNYSAANKTVNNTTTKPNFKETYSSAKQENKTSFWDDLFKAGQDKSNTKKPKKGKDIYSDIEITMLEAINGTTKIINMLQTQICPYCNGRKFVNGSKCSHCKGKGETSNYKRFNVKIPAGIRDLSKIRLAEEGERGENGGRAGDLYLTVHIKEQNKYNADGLNLLKRIEISPCQAVLGGDVLVETPLGKVSVKISHNTRNGQKIRLSGCGIKQNNQVGDMILTVEIQIPQNLSEAEIDLYKKLNDISLKK